MKFKLTLYLSIFVLVVSACSLSVAPVSTPPPATEAGLFIETNSPTLVAAPTLVSVTPSIKRYSNSQFGLNFQYPSSWFGPEEYISNQTLRVEVGSDVVYPYGEPPEQPSSVKNSYDIVVQYSKGDENNWWQDTYQSLANLKDGEWVSTARSKIIRIRQLDLGRFSGFEYISTLTDSAQTEPVYSRQVILIDKLSSAISVLTITGSPNNVEVVPGTDWRTTYQGIDEANQAIFNGIVESVSVEH